MPTPNPKQRLIAILAGLEYDVYGVRMSHKSRADLLGRVTEADIATRIEILKARKADMEAKQEEYRTKEERLEKKGSRPVDQSAHDAGGGKRVIRDPRGL